MLLPPRPRSLPRETDISATTKVSFKQSEPTQTSARKDGCLSNLRRRKAGFVPSGAELSVSGSRTHFGVYRVGFLRRARRGWPRNEARVPGRGDPGRCPRQTRQTRGNTTSKSSPKDEKSTKFGAWQNKTASISGSGTVQPIKKTIRFRVLLLVDCQSVPGFWAHWNPFLGTRRKLPYCRLLLEVSPQIQIQKLLKNSTPTEGWGFLPLGSAHDRKA